MFKISNKFDNSQRYLRHKFGHHAFIVLLVEVVLLDVVYISDLFADNLYKFFFTYLGIENSLIFIILPPIGYLILRSIISDVIDKRTYKLYFIFAPLYTVLYFANSYKHKMAVPLLIIAWAMFITCLFKLVSNRYKK